MRGPDGMACVEDNRSTVGSPGIMPKMTIMDYHTVNYFT